MPQIFLTFALSLLLLNLALMLFSANYRTVHTSYSDEAIHFGELYIPVAKLIAFVVAMALSGALWVFLPIAYFASPLALRWGWRGPRVHC
jgi:branched-chain amino acid transport system permease protein